jgi:osmoprotectant transport system permease protein
MVLLAAAAVMATSASAQKAPSRAVVVASKPFGESYLLAEMFAQLLEARGARVTRRPGLGATEILFQALRTGAIDVYPEYTGTGLLAILHGPPGADSRAVFAHVSDEFRRRWGIRWLAPLGFQNSYAIAVRPETAARYRLETLSDLARVAGSLTAGLTPDFIGRLDGLPGLTSTYGIHFKQVHSLGPAIKYQALASGNVDVIDGYATDGLIAKYGLVVLRDDRHFFPAYEAAALVGRGLAQADPAAVLILTELSGRLDEETMRTLNRRVEVDGEGVAAVAASTLEDLGLVNPDSTAPGEAAGRPDRVASRSAFVAQVTRHVLLVAISLGVACLIALPLGVLLERARGPAESVIRAVGLIQTLPSIALLAFMIPLLGIGVVPALVALSLYSIFPILRNTFTGVRDASPEAVEAAIASGMTARQVLRYVRIPLAAPVIMAGVRTAAVINVGTATLAAFIGAGGLGDPIVAGLALADTRMILSGAIPAALLALAVDGLLGACERLVTPRGLAPVHSHVP